MSAAQSDICPDVWKEETVEKSRKYMENMLFIVNINVRNVIININKCKQDMLPSRCNVESISILWELNF